MLEFYYISHSTPRGKQIISVYFFQDKTIICLLSSMVHSSLLINASNPLMANASPVS